MRFFVESEDGTLPFIHLPAPTPHDLLEVAREVSEKMERPIRSAGDPRAVEQEADGEARDALDQWFLGSLAEPSLLIRAQGSIS